MKHQIQFIGLALLAASLRLAAQPPGPPPVPPEQLIRQFDLNGDGRIGKDEAPDRMRQRWAQIDADADGAVTLEELRARDRRVAGMGQPGLAGAPERKALAGRAYVNPAASGGARDGKSWATAFPTVQEGIDSGAAEVWVARGTYTPGAQRDSTFRLAPGCALYGGFAGNETQLAQRDWQRHETILSGDIGRAGVAEDNAYHVVTGADGALLDGFTIRGGCGLNAGGPGMPGRPPGGRPIHTSPEAILGGANPGSGAGMINFQCAPTVRNCTFRDNQAAKGGAMYNMISRNFPPGLDAPTTVPVVIQCRFIGNYARARGGAVANDLGTSPVFDRCQFIGNRTDDKGGGMYDDFGCSPVLSHCLFAENSAWQAGGIGNDGGSCPLLVNCTFTRNRAADSGAAIYQGTGPANNPTLINCILWGDACDFGPAEIANWHDCQPEISGSCVQGGYTGPGNIDTDPKLAADYGLAPDTPCPHAGWTAPASESVPARARRSGPPREEGKPDLNPPERLAAQAVVYVSTAAQGNPDGRSWATAYRDLQAGIDHAWKCGGEVWVAAGTYRRADNGDRSAAFRLRRGVAVYGGFAGTESRRDQRDWAKNPCVLEGNNAFHVLIGCDEARLDGFTITGGKADGGGYDAKGGGMINYHRAAQGRPNAEPIGYSPVLANCRFTGNRAVEGGAIYNFDRGKISIANCVFENNAADNGGAILDRVGVQTTFEDCIFSGNQAKWRGGAVYLDYGARADAKNCRFANNDSGGHGGAIYTLSRASQLENTMLALESCAFEGNQAAGRGGAIGNTDRALLRVSNCQFNGNRAGQGGGAVSTFHNGEATLSGCRFENNAGGKGPADVETEPPAAPVNAPR